jgi:hypothetical protein
MAPVATGERLTKSDYLNLVASVYGRPLADEIAAAKISVDLTMPGPVTSAAGGYYTGAKAHFDIPLVDFLVLNPPLRYMVAWK